MMNKDKPRVAVITGGWSGERDVSLASAQNVMIALKDLGYTAQLIDFTENLIDLINDLQNFRPDIAFLGAIHGRWVEDGCLQGLLSLMKIPYTNSGVLSSALAMDKQFTRKIFMAQGIPHPEGKVVHKNEVLKKGIMSLPYVIKPLREGSSLGVHIIHDENIIDQIFNDWAYGDDILVEKYIEGKELHVAVTQDKAWGIVEVCPKTSFYNYDAKYTKGLCDYLMPAPLDQEIYSTVLNIAKNAYDALGCNGIARVDIRFNPNVPDPLKGIYVLEVNTQPGFTSTSLVPKVMQYFNMSYGDLIEWMLEHPSTH